jgi:hypothetical protein
VGESQAIVLWVAFTISSLLTTLTMFQSPGTEYLIHYGLLFHYTVVAVSSELALWPAAQRTQAQGQNWQVAKFGLVVSYGLVKHMLDIY